MERDNINTSAASLLRRPDAFAAAKVEMRPDCSTDTRLWRGHMGSAVPVGGQMGLSVVWRLRSSSDVSFSDSLILRLLGIPLFPNPISDR